MSEKNMVKIILVISIFVMASSVISGVLCFQAYNSAGSQIEELKKISRNISSIIDEIENDIKALDSRLNDLRDSIIFTDSDDIDQTGILTSEAMRFQKEAIKRLEDIVESSGLDSLAESGNTIDSEVLTQLSGRQTRLTEVRERIAELRTISRDQVESDRTFYGDDLIALYNKANIGMRGDINEEQKQAFDTLLDEYPDSYSTAKIIALYALRVLRRGDSNEAENYIDMLRDFEERNATAVVLDIGFEAMPVLLNSIARVYTRSGKTEEAKKINEELEINYPNSSFSNLRPSRRPGMRPVP